MNMLLAISDAIFPVHGPSFLPGNLLLACTRLIVQLLFILTCAYATVDHMAQARI